MSEGEAKVKRMFDIWDNWNGEDGFFSSQTIATIIIDVVDALGITIEGVNDYDGT